MTKSLLLALLLSSAAFFCRFLKHHPTTANAASDGTPIATPNPMPNAVLFIAGGPDDDGFGVCTSR